MVFRLPGGEFCGGNQGVCVPYWTKDYFLQGFLLRFFPPIFVYICSSSLFGA